MQRTPDIITQDVSVIRSAFEGQELEDLRSDIDTLWQNWPGEVAYPYKGMLLNVTDTLPMLEVKSLMGSTLQNVVEVCEIPEDSDIGVNTYALNAWGTFHTHNRSRAIIVNSTGDGAYDIAPNAVNPRIAEKTFMRLEVGAGDIVMSSGKILHRGANLGDSPRRNLAFFHD